MPEYWSCHRRQPGSILAVRSPETFDAFRNISGRPRKVRSMSRKPRAGRKGSKPRTDRTSPSWLETSGEPDNNPRKVRKAVRGRLHPPPEEDLGGGDICSLEERPSTEDNMPLVVHATADSAKQAEFEAHNPKRSLEAAAIALTVAVFGALSLLIVDHGLWNRPHVESVRAHAATEAAAEADGALVTPTRRRSLYWRSIPRQ
jgi:hypothetical protein